MVTDSEHLKQLMSSNFATFSLDERLKALALSAQQAWNQSTQVRWSFPVPELGENGTCSLVEQMHPEEFSLRWLEPHAQRLSSLQGLIEWLQAKTQVQWVGLYQSIHCSQIPEQVFDTFGYERAASSLIKLAYCGSSSRALFPLTKEFAETSNNVTCVLSEKVIHLPDIQQAIAQGLPYYECDPKVQSELCLPLFYNGRCVGLIDAEAHQPDFFNQDVVAHFAAAWLCVEQHGLLTNLG